MAHAAATADEAGVRPVAPSFLRIAGDFHAPMMAHCPLCARMGPTCIVESMHTALGGASEGDEPCPTDFAN